MYRVRTNRNGLTEVRCAVYEGCDIGEGLRETFSLAVASDTKCEWGIPRTYGLGGRPQEKQTEVGWR